MFFLGVSVIIVVNFLVWRVLVRLLLRDIMIKFLILLGYMLVLIMSGFFSGLEEDVMLG